MDLFIIFGVAFVLIGSLFFLKKRPRTLDARMIKQAISKIEDTAPLDPAHSVLVSHKIFVATLRPLTPGGTAANVIAACEKHFPQIDLIWRYHKLRNKIAHEVEISVSGTQAHQARKVFSRALRALG